MRAVREGKCTGGHCVWESRWLYPLHVFVAVVRQLWCCVGWLLSFLDGWDHLRGCGLSDITWERRGGKADAGCHWVVGQGCGQHCWHGGGSLKRQHLMFGHASNKCYWELVIQTYP